VAVAGCFLDSPPSPSPHVLIVTLDTVRRDHLSSYGYARRTSPQLDELAAHATLYADAYATSPWTVPTHASLFTGKYPFEHGAHSTRLRPRRRGNVPPLAASETTLAESLAQAGYRTAAFVANRAYLHPKFGFDQGFETYRCRRVESTEIASDAIAWLEREGARPFFLFVNFIDAHGPYNVRPVPGYEPACPQGNPRELMDAFTDSVMGSEQPVSEELRQRVVDQYDCGIANADRGLGLLLDALREHGTFDQTLIVVTSDHGEYHSEHRLVTHSKDVYEEAVRVPLVVKGPGQRDGATSAERISLADVPALVLADLPAPLRQKLRPIYAHAARARPVLVQNWFTREKDLRNPKWGHRFRRVRTAIYDDRWKYIRSSDGHHELYDLRDDPREAHNRVDDFPEIADRLDQRLGALERGVSAPTGEPVDLDADDVEQLRALGYMD
jgi:arylsulfatase A-like enzyme